MFGEIISNTFVVVVIFVLNVMEVLSVGGGTQLDRPCMCCACDHSVYPDTPSIVCLCSCMSEVISSFKSLRARSQVFSLLMLFI